MKWETFSFHSWGLEKGELYAKEEKEKSDKKIVKNNGCNLPVINDMLFGT